MKIVIFGGRGYLGINLSKKLQNQGHNVRIVSNNKFNKSKKKVVSIILKKILKFI